MSAVDVHFLEVAKTPEEREAWGDARREIFVSPVKMAHVPERGDVVHMYIGMGSFFVVAREWVGVGSPKVSCRLVVERLSP